MLTTGRLRPYEFIDHSFCKYRYKECINGRTIKLQNKTDIRVAPTIKCAIENYGMVIEC